LFADMRCDIVRDFGGPLSVKPFFRAATRLKVSLYSANFGSASSFS
jgi:hypothetical protein